MIALISVGTDHHPFDRLIRGVQRILAPLEDARLVVQHGYSAPAPGAENHDFLPREQMLELFATADLVITQVGPGTILDANSVGRRPIAMPRDPARGEHVDGHQFAFAEVMSRTGSIALAHGTADLGGELLAAVRTPSLTRLQPRRSPAGETALTLDLRAQDLRRTPSHPVYWRRVLASLRKVA